MPETEPLGPDDPTVVGPYRLSGRLGMGGQGVVYLGHAGDGTPVAVKVLRAEIAAEPRVRERFTKEIAAARRIDPFCIAQVLDASLDGRRPYIVTEYVEGPSLQQAGARQGAALQRLAVATATALAAIHEAGVVHRDFKPSNVLLGPDGPRVIDFGIARDTESPLTLTSSIIGTPAYMAPEQFAGEAVGPAADVFAWGVVMSFAATGAPSFGADTFPAIMHRVLQVEPDLADLPEPLRSTVAACLVKDPAERPTMQDVLLRLLGAQARQAGPRTTPGASPPVMAGSHQVPPPGPQPVQPRPAGLPTPPIPSGPETVRDGGGRKRASRRRPAVLVGAGSAGALAAAVLVAAVLWNVWPDDSSAKAGARDQAGESAGRAAANPQGSASGGITGKPGARTSSGASGKPSPSTTSSTPGSRGGGAAPGTTGPDGGTGTGGGGGGGTGGGGAPAPTKPSGGGARIAYFTVGSAGKCYAKGASFPFKYSIATDKNPTPIQFSIYFDGRLGRGHPINTVGEPNFSSSGSQSEETAGTHTYRLVLSSPVRQERSVSVKVC